ncbi:MAG TPA: aminoglycoside phosphotransferase family protein [Longimicrobium sp.]|jgi:aminoglycoside phosphotransferase (APT) family kinase protein|uniref:phosphotransferase family protein n=1 Tax=Longimicrobium sp. TaxID=2029185 RepID=UPI002ED82FB8
MLLSSSQVVTYLLEHRFLSPAQVVEGGVLVEDVSRRNRNFRVVPAEGTAFLVKQAAYAETAGSVAREAQVYRMLAGLPRGRTLGRSLPRCFGYDDGAGVLVLELLPGVQDLRQYHVLRRHFPVRVARAVGKALGTLHRTTRGLAGPAEDSRPGWALSLHLPGPRFLQTASAANAQLVRIIQQYGEFTALLDEARAGWRPEALIHHDIKWDNLLVRAPGGGALKMIDWELARYGDPCWDVGSAFNDYLTFWLHSVPITGEIPPERFLELTWCPLERMHPALRALWDAYLRETGADAAQAAEWLPRAVRYTGVRLVQTAYEQMQSSLALTGNVVCMLQLAWNLLRRPAEAAGTLLGLGLRERLAA